MPTIHFPLCWPVQNPLGKPEEDREAPFVEPQGTVGTGYAFVSREAKTAEPGEEASRQHGDGSRTTSPA